MNGNFPRPRLENESRYTDYIAYIEILKSDVIDYEFRTTLVSEFINELDVLAIGRMLKGAKRLYLQQYKLSDGVINKNLHHVDEDLANKFRNILLEYVDLVELRGY